MYTLGIDLGTTYTAAATWRNGQVEIASLGSRAAAIPSVVLRRDDETFLVGEPANRRGLSEPDRVAREFKRRLGDPTPILLGGVPYSAEALMAQLLRAVVTDVAAHEGGPPAAIGICHPANWGPYKTDLLRQAAQLADLHQPVVLTPEPAAAATFYAHQRQVASGGIVAVYDLGGGTFDAAVLRKTAPGFEILGQPEGIERLGGIDFDAAVFGHVSRALDGVLSTLDEDDPAVIAAVSRLREECVQAKESLSTDTDTAVPVLLPTLSTQVRLTRAELEEMVRPVLHDTIGALRRALRSAQVTPDQLHSVLLVGGSSRMPLVAQLVGAELDRPVAVDAHPKHAVAAGAAWTASTADAAIDRAPAAAIVTSTVMPGSAPTKVTGVASVPASVPKPDRPARRTRWRQWAGAAVGLAALTVAGLAVAQGNDRADERAGGPDPLPPDEQCTDALRANPRWVCLTSAGFDAQGQLVVDYQVDWGGAVPDRSTGFHLHLYGSDGTSPAAAIMGNQASDPGSWYIADSSPVVLPADQVAVVIGDAPKVCARVADGTHHLVTDPTGGFATGNCVPIRG